MAETLLPSVRGRTRITVASLALAASTASGALLGLVSGILALPLRAVGSAAVTPSVVGGLSLVVGLLVVGLALDGVSLATGRLQPPSSGRQVPREWGRWLAPEVVAVLYGARLGVGPSTMLSTWTWWSVTVGAALIGPGTGALVGAVFGLVRIVVTILISARLGRRAVTGPTAASPPASGPDRRPYRHAVPWFTAIGRRTRSSWLAVDAAVLALLVTVALTGCSRADDVSGTAAPVPSPSDATGSAGDPGDGPDRSTAAGGVDTESRFGRPGAIRDLTDPRLVTAQTSPAQLEDFVRGPSPTPTPPTAGSTTRSAVAAPPSPAPAALGGSLLRTVPGFEPITDPGADRFLTMEAAADLQPDPVAETALLQTRGFQGGWTRAFRSPANDVVVTSVYQFEDEAEAEFYLEDGLITIGGYGGRFFDLAAQPGVRGFHQSIDDGDEPLTVLGAAFQSGPRWYLVYVLGAPATVTPDVLIDVVGAQRLASAAT